MNEYKSGTPVEMKLDELGYIEAAFAQLNIVDHDGDVTLPGAFPTKEVPMSAFNHASWDGALPVGKGTITEEGDWAIFRGRLFMNTTHGRDAHETLKQLGPIAEFSYGYQVTDSAPGTHEGKRVRFLKAVNPFEVSHVLKGAGPTTHLRAIKSGVPGTDLPYADHLDWFRSEAEAFLKRTEDRAEWRAKEGRALSTANLTILAALLEKLRAIGGTADELAAFLAANDPAKATPEPVKAVPDLALLLEIARARSLGIT